MLLNINIYVYLLQETITLKINFMKKLAEILGTTEKDLIDFYLTKVKQAMSLGFSETEAKQMVRGTFRKQLGL